jgi:hypothetical protein
MTEASEKFGREKYQMDIWWNKSLSERELLNFDVTQIHLVICYNSKNECKTRIKKRRRLIIYNISEEKSWYIESWFGKVDQEWKFGIWKIETVKIRWNCCDQNPWWKS